jgi:hypothetical protein
MLPRTGRGWIVVWYICIGVGFILLALRAYILGASTGGVVLRLVIAAGFIALAWVQHRQGKRTSGSVRKPE